MSWNMKEEEEESLEQVGLPPTTEHEKKAAEEAKAEVAKSLQDEAKQKYKDLLWELVETEKELKKTQKLRDKMLKELGMTKEELEKMN